MPKRSQSLSVELYKKRDSSARKDLCEHIAKLRIPFLQEVRLEEVNELLILRVYLSPWSWLGLGLFDIYTKLLVYYHLSDDDPIARRCHVRTREKWSIKEWVSAFIK